MKMKKPFKPFLPAKPTADTLTEDFARLQSEWYRKLKRSGFDDIESGGGADDLKHYSSFTNISKEEQQEKHDLYYRRVQFVVNFRYFRGMQKAVAELWAEGFGRDSIAAALKLSPAKVRTVLRQLPRLQALYEESAAKNEFDAILENLADTLGEE